MPSRASSASGRCGSADGCGCKDALRAVSVPLRGDARLAARAARRPGAGDVMPVFWGSVSFSTEPLGSSFVLSPSKDGRRNITGRPPTGSGRTDMCVSGGKDLGVQAERSELASLQRANPFAAGQRPALTARSATPQRRRRHATSRRHDIASSAPQSCNGATISARASVRATIATMGERSKPPSSGNTRRIGAITGWVNCAISGTIG